MLIRCNCVTLRTQKVIQGGDNGHVGLQLTESVLRAAASAHPTAGLFQSILHDPHVMEAGTARLRGRPQSVLCARVVFDCAAAWTRVGVRVSRGRQPWGQQLVWRGWA
jgi:hypothetical protein